MSTRIFIWSIYFFILTGCTLNLSPANPPLPTIVPVEETSTPLPNATPVAQEIPTETSTSQPTSTPTEVVAEPTVPTATAIEPTVTQTEALNTAEPTSTATSTNIPEPTETSVPTDTATVALPEPAALEEITPNFTQIASGLTRPLYLTHAGDGSGRLFILEQPGRIRLIENGQLLGTPFLDIESIVGSTANEQGLLSLAFHPAYATNGQFFVYYTNLGGDVIIARYTVSDDANLADPASSEILITIEQPFGNHNGGQLAFGDDGYLYIGVGDGGSANDPMNNAQSLNTLLGKILRIDVNQGTPYGVPENNPFVSTTGARPEIWSYGWRNPWRFSFDPITNDMFIADVGQNQYEEVHVEFAEAPSGQNYGWRLMEGLHCFNPTDCNPADLNVDLPIIEYNHSQGCSITGGYVYRGQQFADWAGVYFYGDYCSGRVWGTRPAEDGSWPAVELTKTSYRISSFGEDEAGELYVIDHSGNVFQMTN